MRFPQSNPGSRVDFVILFLAVADAVVVVVVVVVSRFSALCLKLPSKKSKS